MHSRISLTFHFVETLSLCISSSMQMLGCWAVHTSGAYILKTTCALLILNLKFMKNLNTPFSYMLCLFCKKAYRELNLKRALD